jgi:hypothetical protein
VGDPRARWATAWRAARALEQAERAAVRAECGLPADGDRRMDVFDAARVLCASPVGRQAIDAREACDLLDGRRGGGDRAGLRSLRRVHPQAFAALIGMAFRYDPARLRGLDRPRCRVCGFACRADGCRPDLCTDVSRPAWPKGHTPCAP